MVQYNVQKDSYKFDKKDIDFFINIGFQITRRCNMKCAHCCEAELVADLPLGKIRLFIDKLSRHGLKRVCITGGEPLLRKDLIKILSYARIKGLDITFSTNGLLINKKRLSKIKPYISNIRLSLHGKEKTHEKITHCKGSFKKVMESIDAARFLSIPVSIVASIMRVNYSEMAEIGKICEDKGVEKLYFFTLIQRGRGYDIYDEQNVAYEKIVRQFQKLQNSAKTKKWKIEMVLVNWRREGQCILLLPNGNIAGVPSFKDKDNTKIIGNLFKDSPSVLWKAYPFKGNYIDYYKNH